MNYKNEKLELTWFDEEPQSKVVSYFDFYDDVKILQLKPHDSMNMNPMSYIPVKGTSKSHSPFVDAQVKEEISVSWTFHTASYKIKECQELSRKFNFHLCLGGSVLNKGKSSKDLDLYFLPLSNGTVPEPFKLLKELEVTLEGTFEKIGNDYPDKALPYVYKGKIFYKGKLSKRIDVFILGSTQDLNKFLADEKSLASSPTQLFLIDDDHIVHFKEDKPA